jgi:hypothetical protein
MPVSTAEERSMAVARVLGVALAEAARLPFALAKRRLGAASREAAALAATARERKEVQRRAAEGLLMVACSRNESWSSVKSSFGAVGRLGFTDADRHVQDAALLARWCFDNHAHRDDALRELRRARAHAGRLRSNGELRVRLLAQVAEFERLLTNE